jgi:hypothetical protein
VLIIIEIKIQNSVNRRVLGWQRKRQRKKQRKKQRRRDKDFR